MSHLANSTNVPTLSLLMIVPALLLRTVVIVSTIRTLPQSWPFSWSAVTDARNIGVDLAAREGAGRQRVSRVEPVVLADQGRPRLGPASGPGTR